MENEEAENTEDNTFISFSYHQLTMLASQQMSLSPFNVGTQKG